LVPNTPSAVGNIQKVTNSTPLQTNEDLTKKNEIQNYNVDIPLKTSISENIQPPKIPQNIETPSRKREIMESSVSMKTPGYGSGSDKTSGSVKTPVFGSTSGSEKTPGSGSVKTPGSIAKSEMHNLIATNLALESVFLVTYRIEVIFIHPSPRLSYIHIHVHLYECTSIYLHIIIRVYSYMYININKAAHGPVKYIGSGGGVEYINHKNVSEIVCTLLSDDIIGGAIGYLVGCYKRLVEKVYICICIYICI
jgi:hypothetical protein